MAKASKETKRASSVPPVDLSGLTEKHFWRLPIVQARTDDRRSNIKWIESRVADTPVAKRLTEATRLDYRISQLAVSCLSWDGRPLDSDGLQRDIDVFIKEAKRYLQVSELLRSSNKSLERLVDMFVSGDAGYRESPKIFLKRKLRGCVLFFAAVVFLELVAFYIPPHSGFSRSGCVVLVSIIGLLGAWNYAYLPRQYRARKIMQQFLSSKGLK